MPKMNISRSITIDAPTTKIFQTLTDFSAWKVWSPWLISEPEAVVDVRPDGNSYSWEGKRIGSGDMSISGSKDNESIDYDLNFFKPWKSSSKVRFLLKPEGDQTKVTWIMDSSLPFFMFWMKKSMEAFVGMDYERGLRMLKEYVEKGEIDSQLEFKGESSYPGCKYIGITSEASIDQLGKLMSEDFGKLWSFFGDDHSNIAGDSFSIYHKWDMVGKQAKYTSGIPVKEIPTSLPDGIKSGEIPATKVHTLRHVGSYVHLGNAWTTLYSMQRNKEFKSAKGIHPFETYVNMPGQVPDKDLITDIHFPVK